MKKVVLLTGLLTVFMGSAFSQITPTFNPISLDEYLRVPSMLMEEHSRKSAQEQQRFDNRLDNVITNYQNGNYHSAMVWIDLCIQQVQSSKYLEKGYLYILYHIKGRCYEYQEDYENARTFYLKAYNNGNDGGAGVAENALKDYNRIRYK